MSDKSLEELREEAKELDVPGRSGMNKAELAKAVEEARESQEPLEDEDELLRSEDAAGGAAQKEREVEGAAHNPPADSGEPAEDPTVGWTAQQGAPPESVKEEGLYAEDPFVYSPEQLPDPEVLARSGYRPVIPAGQVEGEPEDSELVASAGTDPVQKTYRVGDVDADPQSGQDA